MNDNNLIGPIEYKRRFGFIDQSGDFVIEPSFEALGCFKEGLACFKKGVKYGFINARGEIVIAPIFDSERSEGPLFGDGLAAVGLFGEVGYINKEGHLQIPGKFAVGRDFSKNLTVVEIGVTDAEHHVINREGKLVSRLEVYEVPYVPNWPSNWDSFGCFFMKAGELFVGFINWKGEVVFPPKYYSMTDFYEGIAGFSKGNDQSRLYGLVHVSGEVLLEPCFFRMGNFKEGLSCAGLSLKKYGFINSRGEWVIEPRFRKAQSFSSGLACVTLDTNKDRGKKGFINLKGDMVIEPRFDRESSFHNGFAQVEYEGKRAVIDKLGRVIWEVKLDVQNI